MIARAAAQQTLAVVGVGARVEFSENFSDACDDTPASTAREPANSALVRFRLSRTRRSRLSASQHVRQAVVALVTGELVQRAIVPPERQLANPRLGVQFTIVDRELIEQARRVPSTRQSPSDSQRIGMVPTWSRLRPCVELPQ